MSRVEGQMLEGLEIVVLDVGHGNTTILRDGKDVAVVDCSRNNAVYDELARVGDRQIGHLIISHSDEDHMSGAIKLIARGISIGLVSANADSAKDSAAWRDFRTVVEEQILLGKTRLSSVHFGGAVELAVGRMTLQVLHPDPSLVLHGPTQKSSKFEGAVDPNDCSAVLRVMVDEKPLALLAGDITRYGFDRMLARLPASLKAPLLVFPHHGGRSGSGNDRAFARELCETVQPEIVAISHGRNSGYGTPRQEIIEGVRDYSTSVKILCTQLGRACDARVDIPSPRHPSFRPSDGDRRGCRCAGTMVFKADRGGQLKIAPNFADHRGFVTSVEHALCEA
ncbi:ComEC/Rec2 family competence protein [Micromonospora sp. DT201]|uniref:ComEC/Rec2 family competence protein n=1 Tax=Micromonospora sp. DT201 TaxID=3393442 RepID=UPI003CF161BB